MDSNIINAVCMGAAVTAIAAGVFIIEEERNRIYIPREPRINAIAQREFYIDSILNRGDRHCVKQIRMKPVGKDMATGNYAKSYADVNLEENTEGQSISIENEGEYEETSQGKGTSSSSTQKRQHRKRNRMYEDDGVEKLSKQIRDVAFAIQSLSKNQLDVNALYAEVMKVEGFDEITLGDAFDHLVQNEMLTKAFMAKNANLRKIWVQNFVTQHYNRPAC